MGAGGIRDVFAWVFGLPGGLLDFYVTIPTHAEASRVVRDPSTACRPVGCRTVLCYTAAMRKARSIWAVAAAVVIWVMIGAFTVILSCGTILASVVCGLFDPQRRVAHRVSALWGQLIFRCVPSWRLTVRGRQHIRPGKAYVLVSNHQSLFDIMAAFAINRQFKWVAKESLFRIPFLGWAMAASRYIKLERGRHGSIRETYDCAREWLRGGMSVFFFPEATRSTSGMLLPFKNGAFKLAMQTGVPIVPIAIAGTRDLLVRGSWLIAPKVHVRITVLEPIDPARYGEVGLGRLRDETRERITQTLERLATTP